MRTWSFVQQKSGSGFAPTLPATRQERGETVPIVDLDPQSSVARAAWHD
jgi:hypothetical protein